MKAMLAGAAALCFAGAAQAAEPCWMVLGIDVSNSIKRDERAMQRYGYEVAFRSPELLQAMHGCMVRVVEWSETAQAVTPWIEPGDLAEVYSDVGRTHLGMWTSPVALIQAAIDLMAHAPGRRLLNVSTDGVENVRRPEVRAARRAATAAGIETNVLVMTDGPANADVWWAKTLATGFVLPVTDFEDFERALWAKLRLELADRWPGGDGPS